MIRYRRAKPADAAEMANVHISSWRETYADFWPTTTIEELPLRFKNRVELWQTVTALSDQDTFVADHADYGVVGIMNGGPARDSEFNGQCEVYCLYLLQAFHGQGIGYRLLADFFSASRERGFRSSYAWVLDQNPAIAFYERTGAILSNHDKKEEFGGVTVRELRVAWSDIAIEP